MLDLSEFSVIPLLKLAGLAVIHLKFYTLLNSGSKNIFELKILLFPELKFWVRGSDWVYNRNKMNKMIVSNKILGQKIPRKN